MVVFHYQYVPVDNAAASSNFRHGTFNTSNKPMVFSGHQLHTSSADINAFLP
jgi:hypothetical protein